MHTRRRADLILVVKQRRDDGGGHQPLIISLQLCEARLLRLQLLDLPQRVLLLLPAAFRQDAAPQRILPQPALQRRLRRFTVRLSASSRSARAICASLCQRLPA